MDIMVGFKNKYGRKRSFRDYKVPEACRDRDDIRGKYSFAEAGARVAFMRFGGGGAQKTTCMYLLDTLSNIDQ